MAQAGTEQQGKVQEVKSQTSLESAVENRSNTFEERANGIS